MTGLDCDSDNDQSKSMRIIMGNYMSTRLDFLT